MHTETPEPTTEVTLRLIPPEGSSGVTVTMVMEMPTKAAQRLQLLAEHPALKDLFVKFLRDGFEAAQQGLVPLDEYVRVNIRELVALAENLEAQNG